MENKKFLEIIFDLIKFGVKWCVLNKEKTKISCIDYNGHSIIIYINITGDKIMINKFQNFSPFSKVIDSCYQMKFHDFEVNKICRMIMCENI